jgi:hypothetical protein
MYSDDRAPKAGVEGNGRSKRAMRRSTAGGERRIGLQDSYLSPRAASIVNEAILTLRPTSEAAQ